jgi:hypothetical protein
VRKNNKFDFFFSSHFFYYLSYVGHLDFISHSFLSIDTIFPSVQSEIEKLYFNVVKKSANWKKALGNDRPGASIFIFLFIGIEIEVNQFVSRQFFRKIFFHYADRKKLKGTM